ncbi:hypothetical protein WH390_15930 (plasmid) [Candidatus Arsenophonus nilaparvatae]|uniref:hypothetical protein n=1 Tax=Candidatus Arsenophonus nilaparvatae TaxID=1247023 RepID=UPI000509E64E|nr:hypothetical protein [Candidatus Arsenophonus nilaparvatae]
MNTLAQKSIIKRPLLNGVSTKNTAMLPIKQNASIVKKITMHGLQLIMNVSLYFPITFVWLTVAFALSGNLAISYPFEPEAIYLTFDKVIDLLTPVFLLSVAITLIICLLRQTVAIYQKKFNRKESTSC